MGKIPFTDDRIASADWPAIKPTTPLGSIPVAVVDGKTAVQSTSIMRYFGQLGGLYPSDPWQGLQADSVVDTMADFFSSLYASHSDDEAELEKMRLDSFDAAFPRYWGGCATIVGEASSDGPFVLGDTPSIADAAITQIYANLASGALPPLKKETLSGYPRMDQVVQATLALPEVKEWYTVTAPIAGLYD